ncbi:MULTISPECIES: hypothetical protein [unclassified Bacillus (in: firmicutes)]|uniref:hypothetical protein n=1 Tax=unclassified Bacillus (in: firmicutes) TaxID=185979 RepID=UPI003660A3D8
MKKTKQWPGESAFSFFGNAIILYGIPFTFHPLFITISKTCIIQKKQKQLIAVSAFSTIY